MYGLINVMPPSDFAVSMSAISFVIAFKKLKIAQIVQVNKLCQRLNLIGPYADAF